MHFTLFTLIVGMALGSSAPDEIKVTQIQEYD